MDQQWLNLSNCILPGLGTVAPWGAQFFHIIILYYFHGGSSDLVFIRAKINPAPINRIRCDWLVGWYYGSGFPCVETVQKAWTTTRAYAHYVDVRQDDYNKDICSHGSYGIKPCIP